MGLDRSLTSPNNKSPIKINNTWKTHYTWPISSKQLFPSFVKSHEQPRDMSEDHAHTENKSHTDGGDDVGEIVNGGTVNGRRGTDYVAVDTESLYSLVCIMIGSILFPDSKTYSSSLLQRIRNSVSENGPKLREASHKTSHEILQWTRQGSPLRALLVITVSRCDSLIYKINIET